MQPKQIRKADKAGQTGAALLLCAATVTLWGFSHRLYATLLPELAAAQSLAGHELDLARAGLAIGYVLMTLPAAFATRSFGYKIAILIGLGMLAIGMFLFYPAVSRHSQLFFIAAATIMGSGLALMEVATSALVVFLGAPKRAIARSSLIQACVPAGALIGLGLGERILAGVHAGLHPGSSAAFAQALVSPLFFLGTAIIALMFLIDLVDFPKVAGERASRSSPTAASFAPTLNRPDFRLAVTALFFAMGAQLFLSAYALRYCQAVMPDLGKDGAHDVFVWCIVAFTGGRLVAAALSFWLSPLKIVALSSATALIGCLAMASGHGPTAIIAILATAFCLAMVFPVIFADTLSALGELAKTGAALMIFISFSGSAVLALIALLTKGLPVTLVMLAPALCLAGILTYAFYMRRMALSGGHAPAAHPIDGAAADRPAVRRV